MTDVVTAIRMLEQLAYELMVWVLFFPLSVVKMVFSPHKTLQYVAGECRKEEDEAYLEGMPPVLFIIIALTIGLVLVPMTPEEMEAAGSGSQLAKTIFDSSFLTLVYRIAIFSCFPIAGAIILDLATTGPVNRKTLKEPFSLHCYVFAPFALVVSPSLMLMSRGHGEAVYLFVPALIWVCYALYRLYRSIGGFRKVTAVASVVTVLFAGYALAYIADIAIG